MSWTFEKAEKRDFDRINELFIEMIQTIYNTNQVNGYEVCGLSPVWWILGVLILLCGRYWGDLIPNSKLITLTGYYHGDLSNKFSEGEQNNGFLDIYVTYGFAYSIDNDWIR